MAESDVRSTNDTIGLRPNRACRNCVQIKAKCVPFEGSDLRICQRCHRLKKTCSTAAPAIRKKPREHSNNRVNQLEKRLDEVTNLLTAIHNNPSPSRNAASLPTPVTLPATSPETFQDPSDSSHASQSTSSLRLLTLLLPASHLSSTFLSPDSRFPQCNF